MASSSPIGPTPAAIDGPSFAVKYLSWVPLLTPAVRSNEWFPNRNLLFIRSIVCLVAEAILFKTAEKLIPSFSRLAVRLNQAFLARSPSAWQSVGVLAYLALGIVPVIALSIFEYRKAFRAIDQNAVNEFLNLSQTPSGRAREHITFFLSAAQLLVAQGGDLNRRDDDGNHVLPINFMSLDIFIFLVNNGLNVLQRVPGCPPAFRHVVLGGAPLLQHLIARGLVNAGDFTPSEQVDIWTHARDVETIQLLKRCGFDINVRNDQGLTALTVRENAPHPRRNQQLIELFREQGALN